MTAPVPPGLNRPPLPPSTNWAGSTTLSASFGLGAPYGYLGLVVGHWFNEYFQLEVGGGWSGGFGPSIGSMARVGIDPGNHSKLSLGLGISLNFTNFDYPLFCTWNSDGNPQCPRGTQINASGSANPLWLNVEISEDLRISRRIGGRVALGAGLLLNPQSFTQALGCQPSIGATPCDAGLRTESDLYWLFYLRTDISWVVTPSL